MRHTILICEDEAMLRADLVAELSEVGYQVLAAGDGMQALDLLDDSRPDLILCDICMPGRDGPDLLARLRATRPDLSDVPFLFLTALGERGEIVAGKQAAADDYLVKAVDYEVILATIAAHLRQVARVRAGVEAHLTHARAALHAPLSSDGSAIDRLAPGIVLLDQGGAVLRADTAARAFCSAEGGLSIGARLSCEGNAPLREVIERCLRGEIHGVEPVSVPRPTARLT
ncbi:response regulator [Sinirhodobacter sp. WL0062]|uniref:Response regulator n=1 Tax=Rhodobacter flavimaris TaxID=2907145 RepID=A0ABS8YR26_9RHOB|nr:response regulator [Sinirhodobacter sp. WL0062]MCE5972337.1 response regulator [Sinirhodobacter sp. WL0062]